MKNKIHLYNEVTIRSSFLVIFLLISCLMLGQRNDSSLYIPQISMTADPGFGPYIVGTHQLNTIEVTDLPQNTSKVKFRFLDVYGHQVGVPKISTGTNMTSAVWQNWLDELNLPLSPKVHVEITYQNDSIADYYVAFKVYPDTVSLRATKGWGPFITNNYTLVNGWTNVPDEYNTFSISNLPPRTKKVHFNILDADSAIIAFHNVAAPTGQFLDSASYSNVKVSGLPLDTQTLQVIVHCSGGPDQGLIYHKPLSVMMQKPKLITKSGGTTLNDSIGTVIQNPVNGQALYIDSVKYASITNGPGVKMTESPYHYRGPLSLDILHGSFTIEGWIFIDGVRLAAHENHCMSFMRVDSLFDLSFFNDEGISAAFRLSSLIAGDPLELTYMDVGDQVFNHKGWHHFALSVGDPLQLFLFYFDGVLLGAYSNGANYNYILNNYNINNNLKTKPLILGGCNGRDKTKTPDFSFITGLDEIRIWSHYRTSQQIAQNRNKSILQDVQLAGYWDFDDLRNHLSYISDVSFNNNMGTLYNGPLFIPENPELFTVLDTLTLKTSNQQTDSIRFSFLDENNSEIAATKIKASNDQATWIYEISSLPHSVNRLRINEICPSMPAGGFETFYNVKIHPSPPIATPMCNWGTYYQSDTHLGNISNSIVVNGFPENTTKVELGLQQGNNTFNADTYTMNSVPYQYSLTLNGTDNYIKTSTMISSPSTYEISLWFKTTTTNGGMLIGLCDNPEGIPYSTLDRKLVMRKNGSLYYSFETYSGPTDTLFGSNKYNDGMWHCATVSMNNPGGSSLSVDGCQVDNTGSFGSVPYQGWWVIGRHHQGIVDNDYAEFFQGSLAYINIWTSSDVKDAQMDPSLLNGARRGNLLYKLDEGGGTIVHDTQGNNYATLMGSAPNWTKMEDISAVTWQHNMLDKPAGQYTFYAKVYYAGGGESGVYYPLGIYNILDPLPGHSFSYYLLDGIGYFNEGVTLINTLYFSTDYTGHGNSGWTNNLLKYLFLSPDHLVIDQGYITWTTTAYDLSITMDMGDAPKGSYIDFQIGYQTSSQTIIVKDFQLPILIRPMLAPIITGDFGPFMQAVAPGTMKKPNTFEIVTGEYNDLTKMTADFYDPSGNKIATAEGVKINNTSWKITQEMSVLAPPVTTMKISYFLGANHFLALTAGPYKIPINKTRPEWFDFLPDTAFHNIKEYADSVTFQISTPFEHNSIINNSTDVDIPDWVPLLGGTSASLAMPTANAYLKYLKPTSKLVLDEPPDFFQKYFNLGAGNPESLSLSFNYSQNNRYELDEHDNLIATQNFSAGGSVYTEMEKFESIVTKIKDLIKFVQGADPEGAIIKPTFSIGYEGDFQYSSRLRLKVDSLTGQWGSFGNLDVDANPDHINAYNNSSSYHFYSGAFGIDFSIGMDVFEGLAGGYFGFDNRIVLGYGHSYKTIPAYNEKLLKSLTFQGYALFYVDLLWGWYEHTLWGPKMIYTADIWNDNMDDLFPEAGKSYEANGQIPGLITKSKMVKSLKPVGAYSCMSKPRPQQMLVRSNDELLFNWLERGDNFGERKLRSISLDLSSHKFFSKKTIQTNQYALNNPASGKSSNGMTLRSWAQSRHSSESFAINSNENILDEFFRSQDIYFSVYDNQNDCTIQTEMLDDLKISLNDGRAEALPQIVMLSATSAMITWQVVDPDIPQADIWYVFLDYDGTQWIQSEMGIAVAEQDIETQVELASPEEGKAVLVWLNTTRDEIPESIVKSAFFNGSQWSQPVVVSALEDIHCNYIDMELQDETGALVYTVFIDDTVNGYHEKLKVLPWSANQFNTDDLVELYVDSVNHIQLPCMALNENKDVAIAFKTERLTKKHENRKISQVDILRGSTNNLKETWSYLPAHPFVCDTLMQVSELSLAFAGGDTLVMVTQEYPMQATNASFEPRNGILFGDPYMNQVFRSFSVDEAGVITDIDENQYALGVEEHPVVADEIGQVLCYPNPCSEQTNVRFQIVTGTLLVADISDISGKLSENLLNQSLAPGMYDLEINTLHLEPGNYIISLKTKESKQTIKLTVYK